MNRTPLVPITLPSVSYALIREAPDLVARCLQAGLLKLGRPLRDRQLKAVQNQKAYEGMKVNGWKKTKR